MCISKEGRFACRHAWQAAGRMFLSVSRRVCPIGRTTASEAAICRNIGHRKGSAMVRGQACAPPFTLRRRTFCGAIRKAGSISVCSALKAILSLFILYAVLAEVCIGIALVGRKEV